MLFYSISPKVTSLFNNVWVGPSFKGSKQIQAHKRNTIIIMIIIIMIKAVASMQKEAFFVESACIFHVAL